MMSTEEKDVVFVLDDDEAVRESLKFSLELEGYAVRTCAEGHELLKHPDLARARCLILDYRMPRMDGFEVLDCLVAQRVGVPVILITSNASDALRRRAERVGVHQVLEKPLSDGALMENIQSLLSS
ncbi:response regulator receiver domain-containing protein [Methylovirgula ligni]|uniref:Response regulator receiver domain-containing protein n=1 Tax=Methylovirgula ligni TaxID=569860 RepID=A0A3D9Z133_9HYPH|nr:response regulator [Methylovirgula ligni]REF88827.1 response regulator receiver domain-containing protein [Methylovirgula ligni]